MFQKSKVSYFIITYNEGHETSLFRKPKALIQR